MQNSSRWVWLPMVAVSTSVYATQYFTLEQVQHAIFPGEKLTLVTKTLSDEQCKRIEAKIHTRMPSTVIEAWKTAEGGWLMVDKVIGKHEFITYAVGIYPDGHIKQIEIMDYRESYGYEIRNAAWRKQFEGRAPSDIATLKQDVRNISGATLSSQHLIEGVQRVLAVYAVALSS